MTTFDFDSQNDKGKKGEQFLDAFFRHRGYVVDPATNAEQRTDIDRWFTHKHTQHHFSVEFKTDGRAGKTGNAFVETESNHERGTPGWAKMSEADYLIYYIPDPETIYVIRFETLRNILPQWGKLYTSKSVANRKYTTVGLLVPLHEFEHIAVVVF